MEKVLVKKLFRESDKFVGKEIKISGWIRTLRASKSFWIYRIK